MRIVLSGGGTAGHITPVLALSESLRQGHQLAFIGDLAGNKSSKQLLQSAGVQVKEIKSGKFRRFSDGRTSFFDWLFNFRDIFLIIVGFSQSIFLLLKLKPQVVFCKGGYGSVPVGLAAWCLRKPLVIHESDARAGLANRILGKFAKVIATGFPTEYYPGLNASKLVYVGNPVRQEISGFKTMKAQKIDAKPTLAVIGGSQGAHAINLAVLNSLSELVKLAEVIHVCGSKDYQLCRGRAAKLKQKGYSCYEFLYKNYAEVLSAADVVVSRAGMNSVAELAALGKAVVLVPHPGLSDQIINANILAEKSAALVINQSELSDKLLPTLRELLADKGLRKQLAAGLSGYYVADANKKLEQIILGAGHETA